MLGLGSAATSSDATPELVLRNAPSSLSVFVMLAIVLGLSAAIVYLYVHEGQTCPARAKLLLAGLRISVLTLLVAIYLDPAVYYSQRQVLKPSIVVLRDASQSMDLHEDRYQDDASAAIVAAATGRAIESVRD